jgi:tRNA(adenine34) deaminase
MTTDRLWMKRALQVANAALPLDVPVGALVVDSQNKIIASAHNQREAQNILSGHAEIIALNEAAQKLNNWRLNGCSLYVTLEPCRMCAGAILQSRISRVVFGAYDLKEGALGSAYNFAGPGLQVVGGILEAECEELLKSFFRNRR